MTVSGWGLLNDGGNAAKKLQEVDLEVKNTWSNLMQIMWNHHAQIIWMKECREDFHYKKNWITSKMMCTFKWVSPQTLPYLHSLEKNNFFSVRRQNSDACQGDSGGPLVRVNPTSGKYEQVPLAPQFKSSQQIVHRSPQIFNWSLPIVQLVPS